MNLIWMVLTCFSLNCNGLYDSSKWPIVWHLALTLGADIVMFQETHLTIKQERSFGIFAQGFDKFYAHGTSQLGGILIAVHRSLGLAPSIVNYDNGHKLILEVSLQGEKM